MALRGYTTKQQIPAKCCPFCGGTTIYAVCRETKYGAMVFANCGLCGAQSRVVNPKCSKKYAYECELDVCSDAIEQCIKIWNERYSAEV